jgi:ABC-type dipeptide/oligopeptide/nickel transport system permease subunit
MGLDAGECPVSAGARSLHSSLPMDQTTDVAGRRASAIRRLFRSPNAVIGLAIVMFWVVVAIVGPYLAPYHPAAVDVSTTLAGSSRAHLLGTDQYGRDTLSRIVAGSRYTVLVAMSAAALSLLVGGALGIVAGYFRGVLDGVLGRIMDVLFAFPGILLGIAVVAAFGPGLVKVVFAVAVVGVPRFFRIMRASSLSLRERAFVDAARAVGGGSLHIIARHLVPNSMGPMIVYATIWSATSVLFVAGLSFLGLGVQPPTPEWGAMLADAQPYMLVNPLLPTYPGVALTLLIIGLNLLGDGLRDVADPTGLTR